MKLTQLIAAAAETLRVKKPEKGESIDCLYEDQLGALADLINLAAAEYYKPIRKNGRSSAFIENATDQILALPKSGRGGAERIAACVWWRVCGEAKTKAAEGRQKTEADRFSRCAARLKVFWKGSAAACSDVAVDESEAIARTISGDLGRYIRYCLATVPSCDLYNSRSKAPKEQVEA